MKCPDCKVHVDKHEANYCFNSWVATAVMKLRVRDGIFYMPPDYQMGIMGTDPYSTQIYAAKNASDKAGRVLILAPSPIEKEWLVEIIPYEGTAGDAVWAAGATEELARCRAAIKSACQSACRRREVDAANRISGS